MSKIYLTHEDTSRMMTELCAQVIPIKHKFHTVVGIERGGLNISVWLAMVLDKKHDSIKISFYGDETTPQEDPDFDNLQKWEFMTKPFLLVDDIVDSGRTIEYFEGLASVWRRPFWIAVLHWCEENSPWCKPDFFVEKKKKSDWIVYPWEKDEERA